MKAQTLSLAVLAAGGCFIAAISGYGGGEEKHNHENCEHDHGKKETLESVAGKESPVYSLSKDQVSRLGVEVGAVEMREFSSLDSAAIAVPASALINDSNGDTSVLFSDVENKEGSDQKFAPVKVTTGTIHEGYVEIKSGLFPGDTVIVKNAFLVKMANAKENSTESGPATVENSGNEISSDIADSEVEKVGNSIAKVDGKADKIRIEKPRGTDASKSIEQAKSGGKRSAAPWDRTIEGECPSRCRFEAAPRVKVYPCPYGYDEGVYHGRTVGGTCPSGYGW